MEVGDILPIFNQLADYSTGQFMKAFAQDANGNTLDGSPVVLTADDSSGLYKNTTLVMPDSPWVFVKVNVYTDNTYTTLSSSEGANSMTFERSSSGGSSALPTSSAITGIIDSDDCYCEPIQDTIIQGADRTLTVRLIENVSGAPFDLGTPSLIVFKFRNADGTVLTISSTDSGTPIQVVNSGGGQLLCVLTAAQTALLAAMTPSPFTIVITQSVGITIVNLPTQLAVQEQEV